MSKDLLLWLVFDLRVARVNGRHLDLLTVQADAASSYAPFSQFGWHSLQVVLVRGVFSFAAFKLLFVVGTTFGQVLAPVGLAGPWFLVEVPLLIGGLL